MQFFKNETSVIDTNIKINYFQNYLSSITRYNYQIKNVV